MVMQLQITDQPGVPIYRRIADAVREAVRAGRFAAGDRLPAKTALAQELGVNTLTVSRGYELLEDEGLIAQRRGSGTYIQPDAQDRARQHGLRRFDTLWLVINEPTLADCRRETQFILTDVLEGLREALGPRNTHITFTRTFDEEGLRDVGNHDAVLLYAPSRIDPSMAPRLWQRGVPTIGLMYRTEYHDLPAPSITYNRMRTSTLACQHLLDCGYRTLGFIGTKAFDSGAIYPKLHAFTNVLHEAGLDVCARYVRHASITPGRAYAAAWQIIQSGDLPEAFFVDTDYKAMEVIGALNDAGLRVPGDVGVIGYDDAPEAGHFTPALTTMAVPRRAIGRRAGEILQSWPTDGTWPDSEVLPATLTVRDTTRHARNELAATGAPTDMVEHTF